VLGITSVLASEKLSFPYYQNFTQNAAVLTPTAGSGFSIAPGQGTSATSGRWTLLRGLSLEESDHLPPTYMGCWGRAEIRRLQNTGEKFIFHCVPCKAQNVTDCTRKYQPIQLSKQTPRLTVLMQRVYKDAGGDVPGAWMCFSASSPEQF